MSSEVDQINQSIATDAADGIQSASNDSGSVTAMSIDDRIKAANHLAGQGASTKPHFGVRFSKIVPPGGG